MDKVLIVSSSDKTARALNGLISETGESQIFAVKTGARARNIATAEEFGAVIIDTPLSDESGAALSQYIAQTTAACMIMLVKAELLCELSGKYESIGIIVLPKPISKPIFMQSFKLACSLHSRMMGLKSENTQLKVKIDEIKLVDRAKCVLIQYLGMTEPMAHRYIEKQAMDMRLPKTTIAENILKTYEY